MKANSGAIRLSASDLSNHLVCRHLTALDLSTAIGARRAPTWRSPDAWVLQQRGQEHERAYLSHLEAQGIPILDLCEIESDTRAAEETLSALRRGAEAIAQATLGDNQWFGRADVLRRVERTSRLGSWSYEVYDCKLARETKAATILQLSLYSELLNVIQGVLPESMYVVPPSVDFQAEQYRVLDYAAYYRYVKSRLEAAVSDNGGRSSTYPEPKPHCEICRWWAESAIASGDATITFHLSRGFRGCRKSSSEIGM